MLRRHAPLAAIFLAMAPLAALALDRGHFKGMEEQDLAPIVAAFEGVQARYLELVNPPGKVPLAHIRKPNPKVNGLSEHAFYLYFNPEDAEWTRADLEKQFPRDKSIWR
jgi:hypothetical protein